MSKIKACPFCGFDKAELVQYDEDGDYAALFCLNKKCSASGPSVDVRENANGCYDGKSTLREAVKAWNARVDLPNSGVTK